MDRDFLRGNSGGPEMIMCLSCGEFITAIKSEEAFEPVSSECLECDGTSFKHNESGQIINIE